jgi:hypothetical protein
VVGHPSSGLTKLELWTAMVRLTAGGVPQTGGLAIERVDDDHWLVELHVTSEAEPDRVVAHFWLDAEVFERDVGPYREIASRAADGRLRRPAAPCINPGR